MFSVLHDKHRVCLYLRTTKTDVYCLVHLCHTRLVICVVLSTIQCTCCNVEVLNDSVHGETAIRLLRSVSNMTPLLWSVHVHMGFLLCTVFLRVLLQVDALWTVSTRQNKLTMIPCSVECTCTYFDVTVTWAHGDMQFFLQG